MNEFPYSELCFSNTTTHPSDTSVQPTLTTSINCTTAQWPHIQFGTIPSTYDQVNNPHHAPQPALAESTVSSSTSNTASATTVSLEPTAIIDIDPPSAGSATEPPLRATDTPVQPATISTHPMITQSKDAIYKPKAYAATKHPLPISPGPLEPTSASEALLDTN
ncbi:hypothetical protein TorRG33x02_197780 [Trema orientale]|uniref:Uncharacterized protein n=1 Tax=Trema orientale TaxID=63057 RepID=A0A2P5EFX5_TREOI|nr:hypothetical protein TorRG33x02_197780 [Trema orientale]